MANAVWQDAASLVDSHHEIQAGGKIGPEAYLIVIAGAGKAGFQPDAGHEQRAGCDAAFRFSRLLDKTVDYPIDSGSRSDRKRYDTVNETAKACDINLLLQAVKPISSVRIKPLGEIYFAVFARFR